MVVAGLRGYNSLKSRGTQARISLKDGDIMAKFGEPECEGVPGYATSTYEDLEVRT